MWEYMKSLPAIMSYSAIMIGILAIVIISLKGKLIAKWGKNVIGLGTDPDKSKNVSESVTINESVTVQETPTAMYKTQKRGCGDCVLIIMAQREKYELDMSMAENRKFRQSMTYAEQKIMDMLSLLNEIFTNALEGSKANKIEDKISPYDLQYKMFYGLMKDSLIRVKDEIRKFFKENGFYEMDESNFHNYVKDKGRHIVSLIVNYIRTIYPTTGVTVKCLDLIEDIEFNSTKFQEIIFDVFMHAKKTILEVESEKNSIKISFCKWIDEFVK